MRKDASPSTLPPYAALLSLFEQVEVQAPAGPSRVARAACSRRDRDRSPVFSCSSVMRPRVWPASVIAICFKNGTMKSRVFKHRWRNHLRQIKTLHR